LVAAKKRANKVTLRKLSGKENDRLRHKADRLLQEKYTQGNCICCNREAQVVHHVVYKSRSNFLRYDPSNLIPLCNICHDKHHRTGDSAILASAVAKRGEAWLQDLQERRDISQKLTDEHLVEVIKQLEEKE
jgi:5-methylcytosine-specific restriction endonuclease McrA